MSLHYAPLESSKSTSFFKNGMYKYYMLKEIEGNVEQAKDKVEFLGGIFSGGSKSKATVNQTDKQYIENVDEKIRENFVNSMTKIIQKNATEVVNENKQKMLVALKAANVLRVSGLKAEGDFVVEGNKQSNDIKSEANIAAENTTINAISNSISTLTSNQLQEMMKDSEKTGESLTNMLNGAVDELGGIANNYIDTVGDVASEGIAMVGGVTTSAIDGLMGSSSNTNTNIEKDYTSIQKTLDKATTNINLDEQIENSVSNHINNESLQECAKEITANNEMVFEGIDVGGDVVLKNNEQSNIIQSFLNCQFKNETVNEVVNDMITNLSNEISKSELTEVEQEGFGAAVASAAEGIGSGISDAATGVGEGVGTAAEGVGEGIGSVFEGLSSMTWIFIACCCLLVVGVLAFVGMGGIEKTASAAKNFKR